MIVVDKNNFQEESKKSVTKIAEKPKSSLIEIKKLISRNELIETGSKEERGKRRGMVRPK